MGNRTNYGTGRMTVDNRQKNERSRSGNPYSSHVKAGKHAGTVYNFKRKSRIRKSLTRLPILLEFIHKYIFLNFVSFYNGLNSNYSLYYLLLSFIFAKILCNTIKKQSNAATAMLDQELKSLPLVFTRVEIVPLISTPKKEPITFPTPPVRSVPPITDDAMASISNPSACCTLPDMVFKQ